MIRISVDFGNKKTGGGRTVNQTAPRSFSNFPIKELYQRLAYHKPLEIASPQEDFSRIVQEEKAPEPLRITRREGFLYIDMSTPLEELKEGLKNAAV